jgi:hypothetical protein
MKTVRVVSFGTVPRFWSPPIGQKVGVLATNHILSQCPSGQLGLIPSCSSNVAVVASYKRNERRMPAEVTSGTLPARFVLVFLETRAIRASDIQKRRLVFRTSLCRRRRYAIWVYQTHLYSIDQLIHVPAQTLRHDCGPSCVRRPINALAWFLSSAQCFLLGDSCRSSLFPLILYASERKDVSPQSYPIKSTD